MPFERSGAHFHVWQKGTLWVTTFWSRPTEMEVAAVVAAWERGRLAGRGFSSLVDCARLEHVDAPAFAVLAAYLRAQKPDFERLIERQALVRPEGVVGAVVAGALLALGYSVATEIFAAAEPALAWLGAPSADVLRAVTRARAVPPLVSEVRAQLADNPRLEVGDVARVMGRSPRTLQRQLEAVDTSFRALRTAARVERAQQLLLLPDAKVTSIALEVGCSSLQHLARIFRAHTGLRPLEWRRLRMP